MMRGGINSALIKGGYVTENYAEWFAKRLRKALSMGSMKQSGLLTILDENGFEMNQQRLSHYFNGRNYPDPPILKELAKGLGVSADWLLGLTEQSLPAADLDEMAAQARGEGKINKVMKKLPPDKQQQVMQFAEYLVSQLPASDGSSAGDTQLEESKRIAREAHQWLDSIQRTRGKDVRDEIEKIFRDKNLFIDSTS